MAKFEYECPKCGKEITSEYVNQFRRNTEAHLFTHFSLLDDEFIDEIKNVGGIVDDVLGSDSDE